MKVYLLFRIEKENDYEDAIKVFCGVYSSREKAEKVGAQIWYDIEETEIDTEYN